MDRVFTARYPAGLRNTSLNFDCETTYFFLFEEVNLLDQFRSLNCLLAELKVSNTHFFGQSKRMNVYLRCLEVREGF